MANKQLVLQIEVEVKAETVQNLIDAYCDLLKAMEKLQYVVDDIKRSEARAMEENREALKEGKGDETGQGPDNTGT